MNETDTSPFAQPELLDRVKQDIANVFSPERMLNFWEVVIGLGLAFLLGIIITQVYSRTHKGTTYSQSFCHTVILMAMVVAVVMMIIGSNIARAFSLVGALSIIRFRTAVKDARDTGFVFFAMAAGMACGTGFYLTGLTMTVMVCLLLLLLSAIDYGAKPTVDKLLTVRVPVHLPYQTYFEDHFQKFLSHYSLTMVDSVQQGALTELTYNIRFKKDRDEKAFLDGLRPLVDNNKVTLLFRDQRVDL